MNIDDLSYDELIDLNRRVVQRLKAVNEMRTENAMSQFRMGERVWFQPEGRERLYGTLMKLNKKTVTVITEQGERWNVSPRVLFKDEATRSVPPGKGQIIDIEEGREG